MSQEDRIDIDCRYCGTRNDVDLDKAFLSLDAVRCGQCSGPLFKSADEPLVDLDPKQFQHPLDQKALAGLAKIPGIESVLKKLLGEISDVQLRLRSFASNVHVNEKQLPELLDIYEKTAERLDVRDKPDLLLVHNPARAAFLIGVDNPIICLSSGMVSHDRVDELKTVLGAELTHWKCQHGLYRTAVNLLLYSGLGIAGNFLRIGTLAMPIRMALIHWWRTSQLTADRGSLLVTGSLETTLRVLMKQAGGVEREGFTMSTEAFLEQAKSLKEEEDGTFLGRTFSFLMQLFSDTNFPVWRASHLLRFARSKEFFEIMAGRYHRALPSG